MKKSQRRTLNELHSLEYKSYLYTNQQHSIISENFKLLENYEIPDHNTNVNLHCVYITIYSGDAFSPKHKNSTIKPYLYIGSALAENILLRNYNGSVSSKKYETIWITERENNPHLFKTYILAFMDTQEDAKQIEADFHTANDVKRNPLYLNMCHADQLFNWKLSEETLVNMKEKLSELNTGENNPMYGLLGKDNPNYGKPFTEERKRKISEKAKITSVGSGNAKATEYHLIDPNGTLHIVIGGLEDFCREHVLSERVLRKFMDTGNKVPVNNKKNSTDKSRNTFGWESFKVGRVNSR
jgi:hypothetical protein